MCLKLAGPFLAPRHVLSAYWPSAVVSSGFLFGRTWWAVRAIKNPKRIGDIPNFDQHDVNKRKMVRQYEYQPCNPNARQPKFPGWFRIGLYESIGPSSSLSGLRFETEGRERFCRRQNSDGPPDGVPDRVVTAP